MDAASVPPGPMEERYGKQGDLISSAPFDGLDGHLKCDWEAERTTLSATFHSAFDHFADRPCIGTRAHEGGGPHEFHWFRYQSFAELSRALGAALVRECGAGAWIGLFASNSLSWFLADFACLWAGLPSMPLWEAWDTSRLERVLAHYNVAGLFCDLGTKSRVSDVVAAGRLPGLKLVFLEESDGSLIDAALPEAPSPPVLFKQIKELISAGRAVPASEPSAGLADHPFTVIFTSGTTGLPKGVVYSHCLWLRNMVHYPSVLNVALSYMPLAFITDRHTVWTCLWNGGQVGLSAHQGDMDAVFRDLDAVRPTVLKGVPKFFEEVLRAARMAQDSQLRILGGGGAGGGASGRGASERPRATNGILSSHVVWRLQPLEGSSEVHDGVGALEVKTGDMMFGGYLDDPAATAAAFTQDGFYQMGDIVRIVQLPDGRHQVTVLGRVKSSAKLSNGKWVYLESLEDFYRSCPGSPQIRYVLVHGDPRHSDLVAVVDLGSCHAEADADAVLLRLQAQAKEAGKPPHEVVRQVILAHTEFSSSADPPTLNGTGKLNRQLLEQIYQDDVEAAYGRIDELGRQELDSLDQSKSFRAQGGSSLQAARIASLYRRLNLPVGRAIRLLLAEDQTVGEVRSQLQCEAGARQQPDERADAALPEDVRPASGGAPEGRGKVLVTGATGFLGPFVVAALLAAGHEVVCLVRGINKSAAWSRLSSGLAAARLWDPAACSRLEVACGDVSEELGMEHEAYVALAQSVAVVVHLAAKVNLHASYAEHRQINVFGTLSVLRFAALAGAFVVFASTTDGPYRPPVQSLEAEPCDVETVHGGYPRSKWVGERLVEQAHKRGIESCIARLGMVVGDSRTGRCNPNDVYCRLLIGFAHTKSFPDVPPGSRMIRAFCADAAAAALAALVERRPAGLAVRCASAAEPLPLPLLREWLLRFGPPFATSGLPRLPAGEWLARAELDAALSAWPVVAKGKATGEFPRFDQQGLEEAYREALPGLFGPAAAAQLAEGVSEASLHAMLRFLFADVRAQGAWRSSVRKLRAAGALLRGAGAERS